MVYFQNVNPINCAHTHQTAVSIVVIFPEVNFEDVWNFCDLCDWVLERPDHFLREFAAQS